MLLRILYWFISLSCIIIILSVYSRSGFITYEEQDAELETTDIPQIDINPKERILVLNYNIALAAYQETIFRQRGKLKENFVLIPNARIPQTTGNFQCDDTEVQNVCAFYVESYEEALQLCQLEYQDRCNAFVLTKHMMVYLKKEVAMLIPSQDSSLFVKNALLKNLVREK